MVRVIAKATDLALIATLDLIIGLGWLLMSPHRTSGTYYDPAKVVLSFVDAPMRWWGAILVVLALIKIVGLRFDYRVLPYVSAFLGVFWSWWFTVSVMYLLKGDGNFYGPALTLGFVWRHFALFFSTRHRRMTVLQGR